MEPDLRSHLFLIWITALIKKFQRPGAVFYKNTFPAIFLKNIFYLNIFLKRLDERPNALNSGIHGRSTQVIIFMRRSVGIE